MKCKQHYYDESDHCFECNEPRPKRGQPLKYAEPMHLVGIRMADSHHDKLKRLAKEQGKPLSAVVRELIEAAA